jgi:Asp/Glu/hydantoin racemase
MKSDDLYTPFLGILMLDTNFPRIIGDAGNVDSYDVPARTHVVSGAGSVDIVKNEQPSNHLIDAFCTAARELEKDGAFAIVSTCGFLITIQDIISNAVGIPVMVSALSLYPRIMSEFNNGTIGILTASRKDLGDTVLKAAAIDPAKIHLAGMEECTEFSDAILQSKEKQLAKINSVEIERYAVKQAQNLLEKDSNISAFLLECGNLPPYAQAISLATDRPVYSILDGAKHLTKLVSVKIQSETHS